MLKHKKNGSKGKIKTSILQQKKLSTNAWTCVGIMLNSHKIEEDWKRILGLV